MMQEEFAASGVFSEEEGEEFEILRSDDEGVVNEATNVVAKGEVEAREKQESGAGANTTTATSTNATSTTASPSTPSRKWVNVQAKVVEDESVLQAKLKSTGWVSYVKSGDLGSFKLLADDGNINELRSVNLSTFSHTARCHGETDRQTNKQTDR